MVGSSLDTNPPHADYHITPAGSNWLWAVFAVMFLSDLALIYWSYMTPRGTRLCHQIAVAVLTTATIAYYSMASDLGATAIAVEFPRESYVLTRQVWFVRYIQYIITLPLILLELLLASGLLLSDIFPTLFMAWVFVGCGLAGALVPNAYKWGYFFFGCMALSYIFSTLLCRARSSTVCAAFLRGAAYLAALLLAYVIAWGCSEGGNATSPTGEVVWYSILDILAGPVFLFAFLWTVRGVDASAFGVKTIKYADGRQGARVSPNTAARTANSAVVGVPVGPARI